MLKLRGLAHIATPILGVLPRPDLSCATSKRSTVARRDVIVRSDLDGGQKLEHTGEVPFYKILCANRGEIAIRVFRAAKELGLGTVAIHSPADRLQPHRYSADEAYCVGSPDMQPVACYLDIDSIITIAKEADVDAIHPGYGFLAENAAFARRCADEGITFIGPRPETIEAMGDKTAARRAATECGVPVVPGSDGALADADSALAFAKSIGFPVILKASMGGGGRGMRVVHTEQELPELFRRASAEAKSAFGCGDMFCEKYVESPRHIEIQILADQQGNVVHLYDRDCSVQRRHQKVVEVAPAPNLPPEVRQRLCADAVKLCRHVHYLNAGTVEFMYEPATGRHYFLEVNPRVQVEHTVTEEITGADIVASQIKIAGGMSLQSMGLAPQSAVPPPYGFAIQCRVTSEDPQENFKPDSGRLEAYRMPGGPGIRLDSAVTTGNVISPYYDSLLCKVIANGQTFELAVQKMQRALNEFQIRGVKTNIPFLENVLRHPVFLSGHATTAFIDTYGQQLFRFEGQGSLRSNKLLHYLADMVVNGADHPGATGPPPSKHVPAAPRVPEALRGQPLTGWRDVIRNHGPDEWAKRVRAHKGLLITDTTWRDAHQSLLATRMRTYDLLRAAPASGAVLRNAGSLEMWGGATFDVALRFLHECPWRRLERLRAAVPHIPFQMLLRGANAVGYTSYADNVVKEFTRMSVTMGVDIFRVFDSLNYVDNLKFGIDAVRGAGGVAEGTICYTGNLLDPNCRYNLDYYLSLAEELVGHGVHALGIKDMAGLLRPRAASALISALRARYPDTVLHLHTHDSAGTGVATHLAASDADVDMVDVATDAMSGLTSQPSMGAVVAALEGGDRDTGLDLGQLGVLDAYWEEARNMYAPFESGMRTVSADVYQHEMPGGQYTNLKFQSQALGLGPEQWGRVRQAYAAANRALGDIIKVTPSSKVVGDLAQFMVQNELDENSLVERADTLSLPASVVQFFQGHIGQPTFGFPEPLRTKVVRDKPVVTGRPGASMPPLNLQALETRLKDKYGTSAVTPRDVLSAALYPAVFDEYMAFRTTYSELIERLPTPAFLAPLHEDEEVEVEVSRGATAHIKYKAVSELQPNSKREVFFETNGVPRVVEVTDRRALAAQGRRPVREKADPEVLGSVGAPMAGQVVDVSVKPGTPVTAGQQLAVLSAMKMETAVCATVSGVVTQVAVEKGDQLEGGDLVAFIGVGMAPARRPGSVDDPLASTLDDARLSALALAALRAAAPSPPALADSGAASPPPAKPVGSV